MPTITIGIVTYNSARFLPKLAESLQAQTYTDIEIRVFDNASNDTTQELLKVHFPDAHVHVHDTNVGFGNAHNHLMREAQGTYYLCLNPDIVLDSDCIAELLRGLETYPTCAIVGPKIYSMDYNTLTPTSLIDSIGLAITNTHKVYDIGSGEQDSLTWSKDAYVFGISGALFLLRLDAAWDIAYQEDVFDPKIFMYKEDVDLAYRLQLADYQARFIASAHAYHVRSTPPKGYIHFFKKSSRVILWSASNHIYMVLKNMPSTLPLSLRMQTWIRLWIIAGYTLVYSPPTCFKLCTQLLHSKSIPKTPVRTSLKRLEEFFRIATI